MSEAIKLLLENNRRWAEEMTRADPDYFKRLVHGQNPGYLFIGCSDSRVAANVLTQTAPGDMFVHRNIANQYMPHDLNCVAVVQYAVEVLAVPEIVVCGHFGCGGVKAASSDGYNGVVDHWLGELRSISRMYKPLLDTMSAEKAHHTMVELSVRQQVFNLSLDPTIRKAWDKGQRPKLTGLVYDLENGMLRTLVTDIDSHDKASLVMPVAPAQPVRAGQLQIHAA